jgi:hypothetical protein
VAEDPGFLLVQAGLVRDEELLTAREARAQGGGTLGEHLVLHGFVDDDHLTAFYASKLVIPRVSAEELARIPASVLRRIPADMAAEFRVVPVAADGERNVTLAMSDPADKHVVDEVAFFTGCYVVRAVATQLQIAWCLAHYYGVMTPLARARLVSADQVDDDEEEDGDGNGAGNGMPLFASATPWEVEEEEETGPARMPIMRRKVERRRTSELAPRSGTLEVQVPPREPERLPAVVVEDEELTGQREYADGDEETDERQPPTEPLMLDVQATGSGEILLLDQRKTGPTSPWSQPDPVLGDLGWVDSREQASHDTEVAHGSPWVENEGENVTVRRQRADRRGRRSRSQSTTDPGEVTTDPMRSMPTTQDSTDGAVAPDMTALGDDDPALARADSNPGRDDEGLDAPTDPGEATTDPMRQGAGASDSGAARGWNVDDGWDVDDGWGPPGTTIPGAYLGAMPGRLSADDSGEMSRLASEDPAAALAADAKVVAAASAAAAAALAALPVPAPAPAPAAAPAEDEDPAALAAEMEKSSNRLLETLRKLERAPGRDEVVDLLLDHMGACLRRRAFFAVKGGVLFAFRQYGAGRPGIGTAELPLDQASTFGQVASSRLPYRGSLSSAATELVERALGSAGKGEVVVVPVVVRGRTVGLLYGDGQSARLFDEHQMMLGQAAGQAFERILSTRTAKA